MMKRMGGPLLEYAETSSRNNADKRVSAQKVKDNQTSNKKDHKVIVFYFYGNVRCFTCKRIERLTKEAVKEEFGEEMKNGIVEMKAINVEEPRNHHFITDYRAGGIGSLGDTLQVCAQKTGIWGAGLLGILFALSFCPVSAALFFGGLFSLAMSHGSKIIMPSLYGIGSAVPVLAFAFLLALSTQLVGTAYHKIATFELWARRITAIVFILAGIYYCLRYLFHWL